MIKKLKIILRIIIRKLVSNEFIWRIFKATIIRVSNNIVHERNVIINSFTSEEGKRLFKKMLDELVVRNGPFKGMKYAGAFSFTSFLLPKLIGSYENEILPVIEQICKTPYSEIINIGCAEGYFAVGFSRKNKNAKVYAFDINETERKKCNEMAILNGVKERVIIEGFCSKETLMNFNFTEKGLVFCDCEGYEKELFDAEVAKKLKNCDLLIELHDSLDIYISGYIKDIFKETHDISIFQSTDDIKKPYIYSFKETDILSLKLNFLT